MIRGHLDKATAFSGADWCTGTAEMSLRKGRIAVPRESRAVCRSHFFLGGLKYSFAKRGHCRQLQGSGPCSRSQAPNTGSSKRKKTKTERSIKVPCLVTLFCSFESKAEGLRTVSEQLTIETNLTSRSTSI